MGNRVHGGCQFSLMGSLDESGNKIRLGREPEWPEAVLLDLVRKDCSVAVSGEEFSQINGDIRPCDRTDALA